MIPSVRGTQRSTDEYRVRALQRRVIDTLVLDSGRPAPLSPLPSTSQVLLSFFTLLFTLLHSPTLLLSSLQLRTQRQNSTLACPIWTRPRSLPRSLHSSQTTDHFLQHVRSLQNRANNSQIPAKSGVTTCSCCTISIDNFPSRA